MKMKTTTDQKLKTRELNTIRYDAASQYEKGHAAVASMTKLE
jgi:hypothetical protein